MMSSNSSESADDEQDKDEDEDENENEDEGGEAYERASDGSNKRIPKEQLPRSSKRLKPLQSKLTLLKPGTRIRVWWTELEDADPRWFVGTVKIQCSQFRFMIVYDHEIAVG